MEPHVRRLASAASTALQVLGEGDRVGIMVFDRQTRIRLRLTKNPQSQVSQFDNILQQERFNGGTDITRALLDAAAYIGREGRRDARRAIVILTDDQTEKERDEARVERALASSDTVLMALLAPDAIRSGGYGRHGGGYPSGGGGGYPGGGYPGGGRRDPGGMGGGLGGIILGGPMGGGYPGGGGRYPGGGYPGGGGGYPGGGSRYPGGGSPGGVIIGGHTKSAGTAQIAQQSGGDSRNIDDAGSVEETLQRIRERYALYFYLPQNARAGQERNIEVALTASARQRYQGAEVKYRQRYLAPGGSNSTDTTDAEPVTVSQDGGTGAATSNGSTSSQDPEAGTGLHRRRRPAVDDTGGSRGPNAGWPSSGGDQGIQSAPSPTTKASPSGTSTTTPDQQQGGWRKADQSTAATGTTTSPTSASTGATTPAPAAATDKSNNDSSAPSSGGGWRRIKPGEQP